MGHPQWIVITNENDSNESVIVIKNVVLSWGKFHESGDKDKEIPVSDIEGKEIEAGGQFVINSCGRETSPSGTEGSYDLVDKSANKTIRKVYWNCPWGSASNQFTVVGSNKEWIVENQGANLSDGAIGNVTVTALKRN